MTSPKSGGIRWVSKDGSWYWDGQKWLPASPAMKAQRQSRGRQSAITILAVVGFLVSAGGGFSVALAVLLGGSTTSDYAYGGWITICCILSAVAAVIGMRLSGSKPVSASRLYWTAAVFGLLTVGLAPVLVPVFGFAAALTQRSIPKAGQAAALTGPPEQRPAD